MSHSGLCAPAGAYWAALAALLTAYVVLFGQALGGRREFGGLMAKPWRMVALHLGAWITLALPSESFDLAVLGNITHLESPAGNVELLRKAHEALRPGGLAVIFDILPGLGQGDLNRALYALGLALRTVGGRVFEPAELGGFLAAAGFAKPEKVELEVPPYAVGMLVATRIGGPDDK